MFHEGTETVITIVVITFMTLVLAIGYGLGKVF